MCTPPRPRPRISGTPPACLVVRPPTAAEGPVARAEGPSPLPIVARHDPPLRVTMGGCDATTGPGPQVEVPPCARGPACPCSPSGSPSCSARARARTGARRRARPCAVGHDRPVPARRPGRARRVRPVTGGRLRRPGRGARGARRRGRGRDRAPGAVGLAALADGTLLVSLRDERRLVVVDPATGAVEPVTGPGADDLRDGTVARGESGLLGVAVGPVGGVAAGRCSRTGPRRTATRCCAGRSRA